MTDTTKYQLGLNKPLNQTTIEFLNKVRVDNHWSYKTLGEHLGCSGPFAHAILNKPSNITTATAMQRIAQGIEKLEHGDLSVSKRAEPSSDVAQMLDHTYYVRQGVPVSFKLPIDLTAAEAHRFGRFIESIPWAEVEG